MTTDTTTEPAMVLVSLLDPEARTFGLSLLAGEFQWNTTDEWPESKLGFVGEIAGAALHEAGQPLEFIMWLPPELDHPEAMPIGHAIAQGVKRGYEKMQND